MTSRENFSEYTIELTAFLKHKGHKNVREYLDTLDAAPIVNADGNLLVPVTSGSNNRRLEFFVIVPDFKSSSSPDAPLTKKIGDISEIYIDEDDGLLTHNGQNLYIDIRQYDPDLKCDNDGDPYEIDHDRTRFRSGEDVHCIDVDGDLSELLDDDCEGEWQTYLTGNHPKAPKVNLEFHYDGKMESTSRNRSYFLDIYDVNHPFEYDYHPLDIVNGYNYDLLEIKTSITKAELQLTKQENQRLIDVLTSSVTNTVVKQFIVTTTEGTTFYVDSEDANFQYYLTSNSHDVRPAPVATVTPTQETTVMSQVKSTAIKLAAANKTAAIAATKLEVGELALNLISDQVLKTLPPVVQMVVGDNPAFKIAIANVVNVALSQLPVDDPRVAIVNEAMMTVAYKQMLEQFNFQKMLSGIMDKLPTSKLNALSEETQA